ncbi:MAG: winged helix-turn-helix transcriptional regulator [Ruegeria sp.]
MSTRRYHSYCPIAKACEVLERRWTLLILTEMWSGSTHFNEIRRGIPGISPTLLARRLREMEKYGLVECNAEPSDGRPVYKRTQRAIELEPIIEAMGAWAHKHIQKSVAPEDLDVGALMWNLRRKIDPSYFPDRQIVILFHFPKEPSERAYHWLVSKPGNPIDLCLTDPKYEIDLVVETDTASLTAAFLGHTTIPLEIKAGRIVLTGDRQLACSARLCFVPSTYAGQKKQTARKVGNMTLKEAVAR